MSYSKVTLTIGSMGCDCEVCNRMLCGFDSTPAAGKYNEAFTRTFTGRKAIANQRVTLLSSNTLRRDRSSR